MRQQYRTWTIVAGVTVLIVLLFAYISVRNAKNRSSVLPSPTPSPVITLEVTHSESPSPASSTPATPSPAVTTASLSHTDQAKAAYQKKDYTTAIAEYKLAIKETSDIKAQADLWNLLGNTYRDSKATDLAISSYTKATSLNPNLVIAYLNLASMYESQNKKTDAKATLEAGLKANPNNKDLERELSILNLSGTEGSR